ncbi:GH36 C-terminal domain-containing protein [Pedobacter sp. N36a]|uniref:GH36 C-terminal domain-containing protein n=1 Tax=Pedobacter sp. N36a TaxID=2767996 RepID=UPI0021052555|nr:GH36 C-terminal domain-containing protein [Pedobacter sp. N36a]
MQWAYSYFYPSIATANHVTDWGKQPIKFRTDVVMMGKLGFDIVVSELAEKDLRFETTGVIFNYLVNNRYRTNSRSPILLKGLDPSKNYRIHEINLYPGTISSIKGNQLYSGDFLCTLGFNPDVIRAEPESF